MSREVAGASSSLAPYAELLDALAGLTWPSQQRVNAGDPGAHRSKRLGRSPEFTEYRAYRPGDDLRRLDWKLFARTDRPYLRIADDHAALRTAILLDASASMRFPVTGYGKWEHACAIAMGLASIALGEGDAVGITVSTRDVVRAIAARRRRDVLTDAADLFSSVAVGGRDALPQVIERAVNEPRITLISDFLGDLERLLGALRLAVATGAELYAVHVLAEEEWNPPTHAFLAADPEVPSLRRTLGDDNRTAYLAAFGQWREKVAGELRSMNVHYCLTSTREPAHDVIRRVVEIGELGTVPA